MDLTDMLIPTALALVLIPYIWATRMLRHVVHGCENNESGCLQILYIAAAALPILAMCAMWIPLPLFYLLLYGAGCLPELAGRRGDAGEWLFINVRFLMLAAPHLIIIGVLALLANTDAKGVLAGFTRRALSLLAVTALNAVFLPLLIRYWDNRRMEGLHWVSEEAQLFSRFVWFCALSVWCDSLPCLFSLPTIFPLIFLIGCNILLLLMTFLFARHVYAIMRDSYLKEEALRLREEALEQHSRTARLEREAYLDALTGVYTRKYALSNMGSMLQSGEAFAVAFLDLDQLKQVNDRQGHLAGDAYLQHFAAHMKARLRPSDVFARYGGDEFLILMPDLTWQAAETQLRPIQDEASVAPPAGWGAPFSFGLAASGAEGGTSAETLIAAADRAMYENKKRRRTRQGGGAR